MYTHPLQKYIRDVDLFNLGFSLIVGLYAGVFWGVITFISFGGVIGLIAYEYFWREQYIGYHNLGYTRWRLWSTLYLFNLAAALPILFIYLALQV